MTRSIREINWQLERVHARLKAMLEPFGWDIAFEPLIERVSVEPSSATFRFTFRRDPSYGPSGPFGMVQRFNYWQLIAVDDHWLDCCPMFIANDVMRMSLAHLDAKAMESLPDIPKDVPNAC